MDKILEKNILDDVLNELPTEKFLKDYWPNNFLHNKGEVDRFFSIPGIEKIKSVEDVISIYKNPIMVVGDAVIDETGGILNKFLVEPKEAMEWYKKGAALEFDFTELFIPELRSSINKLKSLLGLPEGTMSKAVMYAAQKSGGFSAHFDGYCNFIFQIKGEKKWKIAENNNVINPLQHYELIEAPHVPSPLNSYWKGEFPDEELSHGEEVILEAGSFLFLPRGCWHSTSSAEETLSLNFTFGQPSWLDLLLIELRERLIANDEWRELVSTNINEKEIVNQKLNNILNSLADEIKLIKAEDIISREKEDLDIYQSTQYVLRQLLSIQSTLS